MSNAHHRGEANGFAQEEAVFSEAEVLAELANLLSAIESAPVNQPNEVVPPPSQSATEQSAIDSAPAEPLQENDDALDLSKSTLPEPDLSEISQSPIAATDAQAINQELDAIAQLQTLLFNIDEAQLRQLIERMDNPELRAKDVAEVLHRAVQHQVEPERHDEFVSAMVPTIERAIETSVHQHEQVMAEAIFPIVGPAIRKAIAAALESTMQALDQVLEQALSPRALQWKLEALWTGKSFAEVVMLRTLVFRVEQVFLIHRHTGLLLHHCVAPAIAVQDPDLVSAMLNAIEDFVQDSFATQSGDMLETLRFGDLTIWVEAGPQAILAGVIRGQAPLELRITFQQAIEQIHRRFGSAMATFHGDATPFAAAAPDLTNCLQTRFKVQSKSKGRPYFWVAASVVLLGIGAWVYRDVQIRQRWAAYVRQVSSEPGIVVIAEKKGWRGFSIAGLRDPLAINPVTLLPDHKIAPNQVESQWQPYFSLHPKLIEARANQILQPPDEVTLQVSQPGVLRATGVAPLWWLKQTRQRVRNLPGITTFQEDVTIADWQTLQETQQRLEAQVLRFETGSNELIADQQPALATLITDLKTLTQLANLFNKQVRVAVVGHADKSGSEAQNLRLSQQRADGIRNRLLENGVQVASLRAIGIGTRQPLSDPTISTEEINRSVTLQISLVDAPHRRTDSP